MAGDPVAAVERGYQLSDLVDKAQINKMTLADAKSEQDDMAYAKQIAPKYDLSTPDGQNQYVAEIGKKSPSLAMKLQKEYTGLQQGSASLSNAQLEGYKAKHDMFTSGLMPFWQQIDEAKAKGADPAATDAMLVGPIKQTLQTMMQATLPNGEKLMNKDDLAQAQQLLSGPPGSLTAGLEKMRASSQQATEFFDKKAKEKLATRNVESEITHREQEGKLREREVSLKERKDQEVRSGGLSDDAAELMAGQLLAGGKARDVLANVGRGAQGAADIRKVQNLFATKAKASGISPQDILAKQQEVAGALKEVQGAATISAKINYAEKEIGRLAPKVLELSAKMPRGGFVPYNKLMQMGQKSLSNPDLKRLESFTTSLLNAYDMLSARGGTDVDKRAHNRNNLVTADSNETFAAAVDAIVQEGEISKLAGQESMESPLRTPKTPPPAAVTPTGTPPAAGAGAAGGGPVKVSTPEEAAALAPGTVFLTPDGRRKVR